MSIAILPFTLDQVEAELKRREPGMETKPVAEQTRQCIDWIRGNVVIKDPVFPRGEGPFDLYDYQEEFIELFLTQVSRARLGDPAGLRTEKTRQMGDSWLMMALAVYALKWWSSFQALLISHKQAKVDDGGSNSTTDSLMGKARFIYNHLPVGESFPFTTKFLSMSNPLRGSSILGEAATVNAGRGGTFLWGLWDETAATDHSWAILASWEQAVRCPHYLSTPHGMTNVFAHLRKGDSLVHVTHHWTAHPVKSQGLYRCKGGIVHPGNTEECQGGEPRSPWYDDQCKRLTPEIIAQELDISYERSISGRAFPEFDQQSHGVRGLEQQPGGLLVMSIDPGIVTAAVVLIQFTELPGVCESRILKAWKGHDATADTYAGLYREWSEDCQARLIVTGDPAGFARDLTYGKSVFGEMNTRHGIAVIPPPRSAVGDRVRLVRDHMAGRTLSNNKVGAFAYEVSLEDFANDVESAKWPTDSEGRVTRETDLDNNEAEHMADALTYGFGYYHGRSQAIPKTSGNRGQRPATAGLMGSRW